MKIIENVDDEDDAQKVMAHHLNKDIERSEKLHTKKIEHIKILEEKLTESKEDLRKIALDISRKKKAKDLYLGLEKKKERYDDLVTEKESEKEEVKEAEIDEVKEALTQEGVENQNGDKI